MMKKPPETEAFLLSACQVYLYVYRRTHMRTNIVLDDDLVKQAFQYATVTTKKELIHIALLEFVRNRSRKDLRDLRGKIKFAKDYDYKTLRGRPA